MESTITYSAQKSSSDVTMLAQTYCQGEKSADRKNQSLASPRFHGIVRSALHSASLCVFSYMPHPTNSKSKPQTRIKQSTSEGCRMFFHSAALFFLLPFLFVASSVRLYSFLWLVFHVKHQPFQAHLQTMNANHYSAGYSLISLG